jgi:1-acyl-sn-glycerol-3-phosphate acyltransferase
LIVSLIVSVIRTAVVLGFFAVMMPIAALVCFPVAFVTGKVDFLYRFAMWIVRAGVRMAGVRVDIIGRDCLDPARNYIFMANHVSNADPAVLIPWLPRRTSVLVKKELFRVPLLGKGMKMASLVAIDRSNKEAAIASMRRAAEVLRSGVDMTVFPEGTRSPDGRLLPFKKGPFHMAMETGVPIVPVTILGTRTIVPKGAVRIAAGTATLMFHDPIDPEQFSNRDDLIAAVREQVASGLPPELR